MSNRKTEESKKCFVMIGYGTRSYLLKKNKIRKIDLDKTYHEIIEKTFEELDNEDYKITCFRSIEKNTKATGIIDRQMYLDIYQSDLVIADISTLNANVMYELGIRHALKPKTTIIICEDRTELPFDINHVIVDFYTHSGSGIYSHHQTDAIAKLKKKIKALLDAKNTENDSPVHQFIDGLSISRITASDAIFDPIVEHQETLSELIKSAEEAKQKKDYLSAITFIKKALEIDRNDTFLLQRLAMLTYKSKSPTEEKSLDAAELILREDLQNSDSFDVETLGLSGAVYKRLAELHKSKVHLDKALRFYGKGFSVFNDYYNGINVAFIYTIRAAKYQTEFHEAKLDFDLGNRIRNEVMEICQTLIGGDNYDQRDDTSWVYLTLAEIYFIAEENEKEEEMIKKAVAAAPGEFNLDSYQEQKKKLTEAISIYNTKVRMNRFSV